MKISTALSVSGPGNPTRGHSILLCISFLLVLVLLKAETVASLPFDNANATAEALFDWNQNTTFHSQFNSEDESKIYNGATSQRSYSFLVAIMYSNGNGQWYLHCGGALIDNTHVITAGHCTIHYPNNLQWRAYLAPLYQNRDPWIRITGARTTDNYYSDNSNTYNDIGIYTLAEPATQFSQVSSICIGRFNSYDGINVDLVGFGRTGCNGSPTSNVLLYAYGKTISAQNCATTRGNSNKNNQACARLGAPNYAEQNNGDSGGPLFTTRNGRYTLVGLVSYTYKDNNGCPQSNLPGAYTIPQYHQNFIQRNANPSYC